MIKIKLEEGNTNEIPKYETENSAGMDLRAFVKEEVILKAGERKLISTGISIALPKTCEAQIRSRSGLALKKGVIVLNAPGTIDADFRGTIGIILMNHGNEDFVVKDGDRIAQMVISPVFQAEFESVEELDETSRGTGGFGSTGVK